MTRAVRVLRRAQQDIQQLYDYVVRDAPLRADSFIDGLLDAIDSLDELAERGSTPRDPVLRQRGFRYLVHRSYLIFYKITPKHVRIYRVLHGHRAYRDIL